MCVLKLKMYSRIHWNVVCFGFTLTEEREALFKNFQFSRGLVPWKKIQASSGRFPTSLSRLPDPIPTTWRWIFVTSSNSILLKSILKDEKFIFKNKKYPLNHRDSGISPVSLQAACTMSCNLLIAPSLFSCSRLILGNSYCPQQLYHIWSKLWGIHPLDRITALQKLHTDTGFISL